MTFSSHNSKLVLASASPRRREMLSRLGIAFDVIPAHIDENRILNPDPKTLAESLAVAKAEKVAADHPCRWVLAADTVVTAEGRMLGKPESEAEARRMLDLLAGNTHEVVTGYCIQKIDKAKQITGACVSTVTFRSLTKEEINWYVHTKEPFDKAGGYAIQGIGAFFVKSIKGSYTNVVGLPLCEIMEILLTEKAVALPQNAALPLSAQGDG